MTTERRRQQAEDSRERAEDGRQHTEKQRDPDENKRQMAEKEREAGEHLREVERTSERLVAEYSTRALLTRIQNVETQLSQLASQLGSVEALLKAMHGQLQRLVHLDT